MPQCNPDRFDFILRCDDQSCVQELSEVDMGFVYFFFGSLAAYFGVIFYFGMKKQADIEEARQKHELALWGTNDREEIYHKMTESGMACGNNSIAYNEPSVHSIEERRRRKEEQYQADLRHREMLELEKRRTAATEETAMLTRWDYYEKKK